MKKNIRIEEDEFGEKKISVALSEFGKCLCCGMKWNEVDKKIIPYDVKLPDHNSAGMFPLCEDCFDKLSAEQILEYCQKLVNTWKEANPRKIVDMDIVKCNIYYMKLVKGNEAC